MYSFLFFTSTVICKSTNTNDQSSLTLTPGPEPEEHQASQPGERDLRKPKPTHGIWSKDIIVQKIFENTPFDFGSTSKFIFEHFQYNGYCYIYADKVFTRGAYVDLKSLNVPARCKSLKIKGLCVEKCEEFVKENCKDLTSLEIETTDIDCLKDLEMLTHLNVKIFVSSELRHAVRSSLLRTMNNDITRRILTKNNYGILAQFPLITTLNIFAPYSLKQQPPSINPLITLKNLISLEITFVNANNTWQTIDMAPLGNLVGLRSLKLNYLSEVSILNQLENLEELEMVKI
jgi:hypothetical protein